MGLLLALWRVVPQHLRRRRRSGTPGWWWLLRLRDGQRGCREQLGLFRRLLLAVLAVRFANYPRSWQRRRRWRRRLLQCSEQYEAIILLALPPPAHLLVRCSLLLVNELELRLRLLGCCTLMPHG